MRILLLAAIIAFSMTFSGCSKSSSSNSGIPGDTYYGTVLFSNCNSMVIQTDGSPNFIGQDTWTSGSNVYHHVFAVQNFCQVGAHPVGYTIRFKVIPAQEQTCAVCMIASDVPSVSIPILIY